VIGSAPIGRALLAALVVGAVACSSGSDTTEAPADVASTDGGADDEPATSDASASPDPSGGGTGSAPPPTATGYDGPGRPDELQRGLELVPAAPAAPPARVCGDDGVLAGPETPPEGAVIVEPGDDVGALGDAPAGTVFWFAPGVHSFAASQFTNIRPAEGQTFVGAPGAVLDGGGVAAYAFVGTEPGVTIRHLTVQNFVAPNNEGVVNHNSGDDWTVEYSTIRENAGAGLMMGSRNVYRFNCIADNGQYGINAFRCRSFDDFPRSCGGPIRDVVVESNQISGNNRDDWETVRPGCGCTGGVKFWDVDGARVAGNWFHANLSVGLWADNNNRRFVVEENYFSENTSEALWFEAGYDASIRHNTLVENTWGKGGDFDERGDSFPIGSIYVSEAGADVDLGMERFEIVENVLVDNWGGVVLWENSDRFCSSPAHTHGAYCTLYFEDGYDPEPCSESNIGTLADPMLCRWSTENVLVEGNYFAIDADAVGCAGSSRCGLNAVVANFGTFPDWSPFTGEMIQQAITFEQNNVFRDNTYSGSWRFNPFEPGNVIEFDEWQAEPYGQDAGSRITP
jgi:hypothetical protein